MKSLKVFLMAGLVILLAGAQAMALQYGFDHITNNIPANALAGEKQLFVDIEDIGQNKVLFTFSNTGSEACSIAEIYFDDDANRLTFNKFIYSDANTVKFTTGARPANLPSGNNANFSSNYSFQSTNPKPTWGVNPGEWLGINFNLQSGNDYSTLIAAIKSNDFKMGLHAQSFSGSGSTSESFINRNAPVSPVPVPAAVFLLGSGLVGLAGLKRKNRKR